MTLHFTVPPEEDSIRLGPFLRRQGLSMTLVRRLKYREDGLCVNGQRARTNLTLHSGDTVQATLPNEEGDVFLLAEAISLDIVYESPHALVVNKPAGLVMHPTRSHPGGTLANAFAALMQARGSSHRRPFRPIGRLDGNTTGLVLCAMNPYAAPLLSQSLQKEYLALAAGALPPGPGSVEVPLGPAPDSVIRQQAGPGGRLSRTDYAVLPGGGDYSRLRVFPRTGRTHQIRAHLAHIGHPLLGDGLYGGPCDCIGRHALHCARVTFCEPGGAPVTLEAPLPADMQTLWGDTASPCQNTGTIV